MDTGGGLRRWQIDCYYGEDEPLGPGKFMAEKARVISEGAGALPLAAALSGKAGKGLVVAIVSGGNIDLNKFCELTAH